MNFWGKRKKKKIRSGFTLVELLVVVGILAVLLSIVIVAINPYEQISKASDITSKAVVKDFDSAIKIYFTSERTLPWKKVASCKSELASGKTLSEIPSCITAMTQAGQLQANVVAAQESKDIYITECNDAVALCHNPKSQNFNQSPDAKYTKNGVLQPGCPSTSGTSKDCYTCTFSTNEAQECFQGLNPHGSLALVPSIPPGDVLPIPSRYSKDTCANPAPGDASCMAQVVTDSAGTPLASVALPAGYGPEQIHTAYNLPCTPGGPIQSTCSAPGLFGPKIVAIVIAYHAPSLESDLAVYNQAYGLPSCTIANGCLSVVNQNGTTSPLPQADASWALETSLDVQMSHAVCQTCRVLVVEANSNSFSDLGIAVNRAAAMGATAISNSYGAQEWSSDSNYNSFYNHPGIFVTAASGDSGYGASYPASSKNVIAVGGTTLSLFGDNRYASESVWSGTGSGCSPYQTANSFQTTLSNWNATGCGTKRGITDVAAVASPNTGVAVYDSTGYSGHSGWWILGGTSVSSPIVSAALALQVNAPAGADSASYLYANPSKFRDVVSGSNGNCGGTTACTATAGYDGPTGLGSPNFLSQTGVTATTIPTPSPTPSPTLTPTSAPIHYALDDTKLLDTYALFTFADPGIPSPWNIDVSYRTDFGGVVHDVVDSGIGADADTYTRFAYAGDGNLGTPGGTQYAAFRSKTAKLIGYQSIPNIKWGNYQQCGKTLYFRLTNYYDKTQYGPTNSGIIDCTTQVGVVDPPLSWYSVYDAANNVQKNYDSAWDPDTNGVINQTDYVIMALNTKARYGGWHAPEITTVSNASNPTSTPIPAPTTNPTQAPSPTPTTPPTNCSLIQTVIITQTNPVIALPGDTVNNSLSITSNDSPGCSSLYTISQGFPSGWVISGVPTSFTLTGGATKLISFTITVPANAIDGNYSYQFGVAKQGQSSVNPVTGSIQVVHPGPTNTPTPTPVTCTHAWGQSLGSTSMSGNAGDTLNQTLTITNNNPSSCGSANFGISYSQPSSYTTLNLPPSVNLIGGQSVTINFTVTISTGAQIGDAITQYWINSGGQPLNATIHVTGTYTPPVQQWFSNFGAKLYGNYALFEFSYNASGTSDFRLDVATNPSALNQTTGPNSLARYGFAYTPGNAMDSSNIATPNSVRGFISSSPQSWNLWTCGTTIYWRMYNSGDLRIMSPIQSGVVDCTTVVNILPWAPWYDAIYRGVYDARYDVDNNGIVNWNDYWILVRATRLR